MYHMWMQCCQCFPKKHKSIDCCPMLFGALLCLDKWTEQRLWDGVLKNVRVVVSTHKILYDALCHAFILLESLALLVFDEGKRHSYVFFMSNIPSFDFLCLDPFDKFN